MGSFRFALLGFVLLAAVAGQAEPCNFSNPCDFSLTAASDIYGNLGETVGWGYSVTNSAADEWLVLTEVNAPDPFLLGSAHSLFEPGFVIAPGSSRTVDYSSGLAGLFEITFDPYIFPLPQTDVGTFIISAEWWSGDPTQGAGSSLQQFTIEAPYTATVRTTVPEPATALLLACGFPALLRKLRNLRS